MRGADCGFRLMQITIKISWTWLFVPDITFRKDRIASSSKKSDSEFGTFQIVIVESD